MFLLNKINFFFGSILLVFTTCQSAVYAQDYPENVTVKYEGPYQIGDYSGDGAFGYQMNGSDTVFNGKFSLKHSNPHELLTKKDSYFAIKGSFKDNVPLGPWQFQFGDLSFGGSTDLDEHHYKFSVNGVLHEVSGVMKDGKLHGEWMQRIERLEDSKEIDLIFKSTILFDNGTPQKSFKIQNTNTTLIGRFLRDGYAHDIWELYTTEQPEAVEKWHFTEGWLEKITLQHNGAINELICDKSEDVKVLKIIDLDTSYLEVIRLKQRLDYENQEIDLGGEVWKLLVENSLNYHKIDNIISKLVDSSIKPNFKVKTAYYPFTDVEEKQLDSIKVYYETAKELSSKMLNNTSLSILKLADEETLFLLTALEKINNEPLYVIGEIVRYESRDVLNFVSRNNLVNGLWAEGEPSVISHVSYTWDGVNIEKTFSGPNVDSYNFQTKGIEPAYHLAKYINATVGMINDKLDQKLHAKLRKQELMELEEALFTSMTELNVLADSLIIDLDSESKTSLVHIKLTTKEMLSEYSAIEDMGVKPRKASELTECFHNMRDLATTVSQLSAKEKVIIEEYTDAVWNPFTATVMSEQVKSRIVDAYQGVLIPHLLYEIENDMSCDNVPLYVNVLDKMHLRMLEMREEETAKLERNLRGKKDPYLIMRLFNIEMNLD